jgi:predicted Zn-dependent peptidase
VFSQNIEGVHNRRESEVLSVNEKREAVFKKDIDQVNIILTAAIGKSDEKSSKAIDLFTTMLSGGMSFPLFQEVRTKRGLCYDISAGAVRFSDVGNFSIYIGTDPGRYREAIGAAMGVISSSKEDKELLERAKQVELGRLALACENTGSVINMAASQIFQVGRPLGYKELEEEIKDIKISDISSAVDQYLKPENIRQVLLVPKNLEIK